MSIGRDRRGSSADPPSNLFQPVSGDYGAHGRFDSRPRTASWEMFTDRHRNAFWVAAGVGLLTGAALLMRNLCS